MRIVTIRIYRIFMLFRNGNLGLIKHKPGFSVKSYGMYASEGAFL